MNTPHNPTGAVLSAEEAERVYALAESARATVLSDEAYRWLRMPGGEDLAAPMFNLGYAGISVGTMSKPFGLPGLRIGWLAAPKDIAAQCWAMRDYISLSPGKLNDALAILAIKHREEIIERNQHIIASNLAATDAWIARHADILSWKPPRGGLVALLRYEVDIPSLELADKLAEEYSEYPDIRAVDYRGRPEGFAERLGVRVADFSAVTEYDIAQGRNVLETPYGPATITSPCGYAVLEPWGDTQAIATLGDETLGVRTANGRFTWYGLTLSAGFGDVGDPGIVLGLAHEAGVEPPVAVEGDRVVSVARRSRQGGWLVFAFNIERTEARVTVRPRWQVARANDLLSGSEVALQGDGFKLRIEPWAVAVVHCTEAR